MNNTENQVESVVIKENKLFANTKKAIKKALRPQWKKWKDSYDTNRFYEAMWMQQVELSPANREQLRALDREIETTKQMARFCFTQQPTKLRTKQLCGYTLTAEEEKDAFNYAVEAHFSALNQVLPTEDDQLLFLRRDEAFSKARRNTPIKKATAEVEEMEVVTSAENIEVDYDFAENVLKEMISTINGIQATLSAAPKSVEIIEVAAETLPVEQVAENTTPLTDEKLAELRQAMNGKTKIRELKLKHLKLYAKAHRIYVPGRKTAIDEIRQVVVTAQKGSTKIVKI